MMAPPPPDASPPGLGGFGGFVGFGGEACRMLKLRAHQATPLPSPADSSPRCRSLLLLPNATARECMRACLSQPFCEAATHVGPAREGRGGGERRKGREEREGREGMEASGIGRCYVRAAGGSTRFSEQRKDSPSLFTAFYRHCSIPSCSLQARLDAACRALGDRKPACAGYTLARNRRIFHRLGAGHDDFEWVCVREGSGGERLALACVDDRGHMSPCRVEHNVSFLFNTGCGLESLHDIHRRGCGVPSCLNSAGGMRMAASPIPPSIPSPPSSSPSPPYPQHEGGRGAKTPLKAEWEERAPAQVPALSEVVSKWCGSVREGEGGEGREGGSEVGIGGAGRRAESRGERERRGRKRTWREGKESEWSW